MNDPYVAQQWAELCDHVRMCAHEIAENATEREFYLAEAEAYAARTPPERYRDLLAKTSEAARIAVNWQNEEQEALIDEAIDESFPASDPPAFTHVHA